MRDKLTIFDTTLRDGEQALQASLSLPQKIQIAKALQKLGVDVIEAGFPVSSPGDFHSVSEIARVIRESQVCGLARCVKRDIEAAGKALAHAAAPRLHVFVATSKLHVAAKLKRSAVQIREMAVEGIQYARQFCDDVEFSCEDAGRTDPEELRRMVEVAIDAGAKTINVPDTVGYTLPWQYGGIIKDLYAHVPNIDKATISVHCHDDLGLSVANSLSAVHEGARQVEGTINGLGERAGNCALEEVIMAVKLHEKDIGVHTGIHCAEIATTSRIIEQVTGVGVGAHKAIVGSNAFSHSSGIHQDGVLKNRGTYEIMSPQTIGLRPKGLNLTSRSGRAAIKNAMDEMGYTSKQYDLQRLYEDFLKLSDQKGHIYDYDLEALAFIGLSGEKDAPCQLKDFSYQSDARGQAQASVTLHYHGQDSSKSSHGNGPIDAIFDAITSALNFPVKLLSFDVSGKGSGRDALGEVHVRIDYKGRQFHGIGLQTDTVKAAALAFIDAINHVMRAQKVSDLSRAAS